MDELVKTLATRSSKPARDTSAQVDRDRQRAKKPSNPTTDPLPNQIPEYLTPQDIFMNHRKMLVELGFEADIEAAMKKYPPAAFRDMDLIEKTLAIDAIRKRSIE